MISNSSKVISDLSEWPKSACGGKLKALEESILCPICGEFFENPHSLKCGHSFCSVCIRKHLDRSINPNTFESCPSCKEKCTTFDLRADRVLCSVVLNFKESRRVLIDSVQKSALRDSQRGEKELGNRGSSHSNIHDIITKTLPHKTFFKFSKQKAKQELQNLCSKPGLKGDL